jgi:DNA-binding response OmpR family regulator
MDSKTYKILVTEDEKPLAHALQFKLTKAGFEVELASDGEEALSILKKNSFDLIILDLIMPKLDGFGVLTELQKRKNKIPVIVASNLSQGEDAAKAKSLGAVDFFIKSDTPINDLVARVNKFLKK